MATRSIARTCGQCGSEFLAVKKEVNKGGGKFCNMTCRIAYIKLHPPNVSPDRGDGMKRCPKCGEVKPFAEFGKGAGRCNGLSGHCKPCVSKRTAQWGRENSHTKNATNKAWNAANPARRMAIHRRAKLKAVAIAQVATLPKDKTCRKCGITKPLDRFRKHRGSRDGHSAQCGACMWARNKAWRETRPELEQQRRQEQYRADPERYRAKARRHRATRLGLPGTHTTVQWVELCRHFGGMCVKCGAHGKLEEDHIIPVTVPGSSDSIENIQPLCRKCNAGKSNKNCIDYRETPFTGSGVSRYAPS